MIGHAQKPRQGKPTNHQKNRACPVLPELNRIVSNIFFVTFVNFPLQIPQPYRYEAWIISWFSIPETAEEKYKSRTKCFFFVEKKLYLIIRSSARKWLLKLTGKGGVCGNLKGRWLVSSLAWLYSRACEQKRDDKRVLSRKIEETKHRKRIFISSFPKNGNKKISFPP